MNTKSSKTCEICFLALIITETTAFSVNAQTPSYSSPAASADRSSADGAPFSADLSQDAAPASCPEVFVIEETEGPYYKKGSPERTNLIEEGVAGEPFTLTGYVFDRDCRTIAGAWLDFWQADGNGNYDNVGYRLRGHQITDEHGRYVLKTVLPEEYSGRTNHIHVKVSREPGGSVITSQLFFPGGRLNANDRIFHETLMIKMNRSMDGQKAGFFNFRLNR